MADEPLGKKMNARVKDTEHAKRFALFVQTLYNKKSFTDLCFVCARGHKVYAHKFVFCTVSTLLKEMFLEIEDNLQTIVVHLPGIERYTMELVLDFLYEGAVKVSQSEYRNFTGVMDTLRIVLTSPNANSGRGGNAQQTVQTRQQAFQICTCPRHPMSKMKLDANNPEALMEMSKKGRTLTVFVSVIGNPTRDETDHLTKMRQGRLWNNHIQAKRSKMADDPLGKKMNARVKDTEHAKRVALSVQTLHVKNSFTDLCFVCAGGHKVYAHKLVFCTVSTLLQEMFLEIQDNLQTIVVLLPGIERHTMTLVLDFLYEGAVKVSQSEYTDFEDLMYTLGIVLTSPM